MVAGGIFTMMDISASALRAERARMNVHANNLANVNSTHDTKDANGRWLPYCRKRIIFSPGAPEVTGNENLGVKVESIEDDTETNFIEKYDPGNPDADPETGIVLMPNVQVPLEMVDMMVAQRAYEANITAIESARDVMRGALQIIA